MAQWVKVLALQAREPEFSSWNPQAKETATSDLQNKTENWLLNKYNSGCYDKILYGARSGNSCNPSIGDAEAGDYCPVEAILVHITSLSPTRATL